MTVNQLVLIGDSITARYPSGGSFAYGVGGQGVWAQLVTERLANISGLGPLVSSGFISCVNATSAWAFSSGWSSTDTTDAWDISLYGKVAAGTIPTGKYANGSTKTATFTATADLIFPNVGFTLYYADYTNAGTWSYSTDGGSNYTNIPDSPQNGNKVAKFHVATPLTLGQTVILKAANTANTGAGLAPLGIEAFYQEPSTASGLIVHNLGVAGSDLHSLVASTSGDRMAWFKSSKVRIGTGAISHIPNVGTVNLQINDVSSQGDSTVYGTDITSFNTVVSPLGPVGFIAPYECYYAGAYPQATQTAFRSQASTSATSLSAKFLNWYSEYANLGFTGYDAIKPAGFLADGLHPSQLGHIYLANRTYWWIRSQFLSTYGTAGSNYTAKGKQAAVAYVGTQAAVAYAAAAPIGVVPV